MKHFRLERETWLRSLEYMEQENIFFKTNLAYLIKNDTSADILEEAEHFQNIFINKDKIISLLRYDVYTQEKLTVQQKIKADNLPVILEKQEKIRKDMAVTELDFNRLKSVFNTFLYKSLSL